MGKSGLTVLEPFKDMPPLGRLVSKFSLKAAFSSDSLTVVRDGGATIGVGVVKSVEEYQPLGAKAKAKGRGGKSKYFK